MTARFLRVDEVCKMLNISRSTAWRWERHGLLPARRLIGPNVVGFVRDEIEAFIASRPTCSERPGEGPSHEEHA